jgi:hypothetical protein
MGVYVDVSHGLLSIQFIINLFKHLLVCGYDFVIAFEE